MHFSSPCDMMIPVQLVRINAYCELKDDIEMSYEETVHRFGLTILAEARENRIILESK